MAREWLDDPEITGDEDKDPEFRKEMYETFKEMGIKPERLDDPKVREEYIKFLKSKPKSARAGKKTR